MIVMAAHNLAEGVELFVSYLSNEMNYMNLAGRKATLAQYFEHCDCSLCALQVEKEYVDIQVEFDQHLRFARSRPHCKTADLEQRVRGFLELLERVVARG